jgi:hypothetical protein
MPYGSCTSDTPKVRDKQETGYRNTKPDFGIFMLRVTGQLISWYTPTVSRMLEEVTLLTYRALDFEDRRPQVWSALEVIF